MVIKTEVIEESPINLALLPESMNVKFEQVVPKTEIVDVQEPTAKRSCFEPNPYLNQMAGFYMDGISYIHPSMYPAFGGFYYPQMQHASPSMVNSPQTGAVKVRPARTSKNTAFTYPNLVAMALLNAPGGKADVSVIYDFVLEHFPGMKSHSLWKNSIRHALIANPSAFQKIEHSDPSAKTFLWGIVPGRKEKLIQGIWKVANSRKAEALGMKDTDSLERILSGEMGLPAIKCRIRLAKRPHTQESPAQQLPYFPMMLPRFDQFGSFCSPFQMPFGQPQQFDSQRPIVKEEPIDEDIKCV